MAANGEFTIEETTLGEMWEVEKASGQSFDVLMSTRIGQMLVVAFIRRSRSSGTTPSWHELLGLPLQDVPSWISSSPPASDGPPPRSPS
jgi:hypothetical protein